MSRSLSDWVVAVICVVIFMVYIIFVTNYLPLGVPRAIITATLLVVLGFLSAVVMTGRLWLKLLLILAVPVVHIAYEGIDPVKPSLNLVVGVVELMCLWIGVTIGHFVRLGRPASTG
jgi:hypothetical protein